MTIGERIRKLRGAETQESFGKKLGVSSQYISQLEKGNSQPSLELAMKLCDIYGVTLDWIFVGKQIPKVQEPDTEYIRVKKDDYIELLETAYGKVKNQNERIKNIAGDN